MTLEALNLFFGTVGAGLAIAFMVSQARGLVREMRK